MADDKMSHMGQGLGLGNGPTRARLEARLKLITERRRAGRAGTIDEWCRSVVKSLPPANYMDGETERPIKYLAESFVGLVKYIHSIGKLHIYTPFLPEIWDADTVGEIISGCHPTPRYFSTLAHDYDFMEPEARRKLLEKWKFYFANDDHEAEKKYNASLAKYNPFAAAWARRIWRKRHRKNSTQEDRRAIYEAELRSNDISDTLTEMMRLVEAEGLHQPDPKMLLDRLTEGDIFDDSLGQASIENQTLDLLSQEERDYADDTAEEHNGSSA